MKRPSDDSYAKKLDELRRESHANFEHWDGQFRALVARFNEAIRRFDEYTEDRELQPVEVHTHDNDSEGGSGVIIDHGVLSGLSDDDHSHYLREKTQGGVASEVPTHTHASAVEAGQFDHGNAAGLADDDHTQYAHLSQAETFTGEIRFGNDNAYFGTGAAGSGPRLNLGNQATNDIWLDAQSDNLTDVGINIRVKAAGKLRTYGQIFGVVTGLGVATQYMVNTVAAGVINTTVTRFVGMVSDNPDARGLAEIRIMTDNPWYTGRLSFYTNSVDGTDPAFPPTEKLRLDPAGNLWFNPAAGLDTNLYRSAVDTLKTDDALVVLRDITAGPLSGIAAVTAKQSDASTPALNIIGTVGGRTWSLIPAGTGTALLAGAAGLAIYDQNAGAERLSITSAGKVIVLNELEIDGALNHDGTTVGFYGVAPVTRPAAYTPTNVTTDRSYDANATTIDELADVLGTLIADLQAVGLLQ